MASSCRTPSPTPSKLPPVPSSPTYSVASTSNALPSYLNLPDPPAPHPPHAILSKADLLASQSAYTELLSSAKAYRLALSTLSNTASAFGSSLESCARLKEARSEALSPPGGSLTNSFTAQGSCTADSLLAASGVHQLIANHQQILSECVYRSFEVPLLHELDQWTRHIEEEEVSYQREAKILSKQIQKMEKEGLKLHKQRKRDVGKFRSHLVALTGKLDGLTELHGGHARRLLRDSQETSMRIVEGSSSLVKAEVDIFEAVARKGWAGGGLDELLEKGKDLFAAEEVAMGRGDEEGQMIFSILPQKSILAEPGSPMGPESSRRGDSLLDYGGDRFQSLAGAVISPTRERDGERDTDGMSVFSERDTTATGILNKPRGVRPFSPPPAMNRASKDPLNPERTAWGERAHDNEEEDDTETIRGGPRGDEPVKEDDNRGRERGWSEVEGAVFD